MQIYFHSRLCSYLSRVPILVEGTVVVEKLYKFHTLVKVQIPHLVNVTLSKCPIKYYLQNITKHLVLKILKH